MLHTLCPCCGAQIVFRSTIAVLAVCDYCQSTLLREFEQVREIGKIGKVLEDYSPIQLASSGQFSGQNFTVVGRIQLRYAAGLWNEWYLLFDDGTSAWLGEADGQYMLTRPLGIAEQAPEYASLQIESRYAHAERQYVICDLRTAQCIGGQGELPIVVAEGWQARLADGRCLNDFITLDYSDEIPQLYQGQAVSLAQLQMQLLREPEQIMASAGRLKGASVVLDCPSCGGPLNYRAAVATQLVCPACASSVDCAGDKAEVLATHSRLEARASTLQVGEKAKLAGGDWEIIGLLQREECEDPSSGWTEYLLYHPSQGLQWLSEALDGWWLGSALQGWPQSWQNSGAVLDKVHYRALYPAYRARVKYAAGAFNWRVAVGDEMTLCDYEAAGKRLCREWNEAEINWSSAQRVTRAQLAQWFQRPELMQADAGISSEQTEVHALSTKMVIWLLLINLPLALLGDSTLIGLILVGLAWWLLRLPLAKKGKTA